ncbi:MAG TPA: lysophospholipid acyltransferase family protein [Burkholderiales bacterium]|nr:lysophospholipid acyltransferase family protein [Burkholderiales bacterium]
MLTGLLRLAAQLPLSVLHALGGALGWLVYLCAPTYASRLRENLLQSGLWNDTADFQRLLHENIAQAGKAAAELPAVWFRPQAQAASLIKRVHGWESIEATRAAGKGVIFLTPHLGCFEILPQWITLRMPVTVLYRPPKLRWLEPVMLVGRTRPNMTATGTDLSGVRMLLKALRRGEGVGILPDQAPGTGEGEWADFFGRPAYTMTLALKLSESTGAPIVLTWALRLPGGRGFEASFEPLPAPLPGESAARQLNRALEAVIRRCPQQYLWSYNRYKTPRGVRPPDAHDGH